MNDKYNIQVLQILSPILSDQLTLSAIYGKLSLNEKTLLLGWEGSYTAISKYLSRVGSLEDVQSYIILDTVQSIKISFSILITNMMVHHLPTGVSNHIWMMDGLLKGLLGLGKVKDDDLKVPLGKCGFGSLSDFRAVIPYINIVFAMMALRGYRLGAV
jgi:hypothetical protein